VHVSVLVFSLFTGGWVRLQKGSQTLNFRGAHQVLDKSPQRNSSMPRGQGLTFRSSGTQAMVAKPPITSQKLILETTFAIKEDFSKNEATKWAV
jgi:hypothetical protein